MHDVFEAIPEEELEEEKLEVFESLEATLWPDEPSEDIPEEDPGELMFKSDTFLLLLLLLMLLLFVLFVKTGSSPVNDVAS